MVDLFEAKNQCLRYLVFRWSLFVFCSKSNFKFVKNKNRRRGWTPGRIGTCGSRSDSSIFTMKPHFLVFFFFLSFSISFHFLGFRILLSWLFFSLVITAFATKILFNQVYKEINIRTNPRKNNFALKILISK